MPSKKLDEIRIQRDVDDRFVILKGDRQLVIYPSGARKYLTAKQIYCAKAVLKLSWPTALEAWNVYTGESEP